MRRTLASFIAASALAWSACGGGTEAEAPKPSGAPMGAAPAAAAEPEASGLAAPNQAPVVESLVLHPAHPHPGGTVEARFEAWDPDGDAIRIQIVWSIDGRVFDRGDHRQMALAQLRKGAEIRATVTATDGIDESAARTAWASIANQLPVIEAIFLDPQDVWSGVVVKAAPRATDPDGDPITFEYEWRVPSRGVNLRSETLDTTGMRRGDEVELRVRASDGEGETAWSRTEFALGNAPPELPENPQFRVEQGEFRHTLKATDPDGDRSLRFRLVEGPKAMKVDSVTGLISWRPGAEDAGVHPVEVSVSDSLGDASSLRFELAVSLDDSPPASTD